MTELFSPPRIAPVAARSGFKDGRSLDKETGWDATKDDDFEAMWKHTIEDELYFVHMRLPRRKLSFIQQRVPLGRRVDLAQPFEDAKLPMGLVRAVVEEALCQLERGRHFARETLPRRASLKVPVMRQLLQMKRGMRGRGERL